MPASDAPRRRLQRLSDIASDHVRELIVSGQLRPGEFIRPESIAEDLGISATPAREGLLQLQSEGFLDMVPRRGFSVSSLSESDIRDIYDAQALLGGELAARAAASRTPQTIASLKAVQKSLEHATASGNYDEVERLNHEFHAMIYRAGNSRRIRWLLKRTLAYAPRKFFAKVEGWPDASAADHRAIIEHLQAGDAERSRAAMADHIRHAGTLLAQHLAVTDQDAIRYNPTRA
ncbi:MULTISPECIES: GntR family transcriptional regulator [unclassified Mycolicibacterium]|uniref:GntR family transcriptional regulator n=1 Tax=unclassified Mycolicibacterium TaxID=2636767 RepID=UPI001F4C2FB9|nr:GntR family transcriptional regulator [Mycolicibacterium sp. YH-1]UNB52186.1 GntR family transcriptional regulator [Mycolicibacterium sp. YH-1]